MNRLKGIIEHIQVEGSLSLVKVKVEDILFTSIIIDTPDTAPYLQQGHAVQVIFKETEVIIGKGEHPRISLQNQLAGTIQQIQAGALLSKLVLQTQVGEIAAIITTNAVKQLNLQLDTPVLAMVKTNEIMLATYD